MKLSHSPMKILLLLCVFAYCSYAIALATASERIRDARYHLRPVRPNQPRPAQPPPAAPPHPPPRPSQPPSSSLENKQEIDVKLPSNPNAPRFQPDRQKPERLSPPPRLPGLDEAFAKDLARALDNNAPILFIDGYARMDLSTLPKDTIVIQTPTAAYPIDDKHPPEAPVDPAVAVSEYSRQFNQLYDRLRSRLPSNVGNRYRLIGNSNANNAENDSDDGATTNNTRLYRTNAAGGSSTVVAPADSNTTETAASSSTNAANNNNNNDKFSTVLIIREITEIIPASGDDKSVATSTNATTSQPVVKRTTTQVERFFDLSHWLQDLRRVIREQIKNSNKDGKDGENDIDLDIELDTTQTPPPSAATTPAVSRAPSVDVTSPSNAAVPTPTPPNSPAVERLANQPRITRQPSQPRGEARSAMSL